MSKDKPQIDNKEIEGTKENNNQESKQEEKKPSKKAISIFIAVDVLIVIIIILLLCLKNCKPVPNQDNSGEQPIDTVRVNKITDIFRSIVKKNMDYVSITDNNIDKVVGITYSDNYPNTFNLNISVTTESNLYYLTISDYTYDGNKEEYNNFLDYLLLDTTEYKVSHGNNDIYKSSILDTKITTSQNVNRYIISESTGGDKYINGFYKDNNEFYVYQNTLITEGVDPFTKSSNQIIKSDSPLYDYYRALLIV